MNRYEQLFSRLALAKEGAFVPFVTIGDPNLEQSFEIIETLINAGADALELGIPFSDPLADGPTIQNATLRALHSGTTPETCFQLLARIRAKYPDIPIGLLMYANLVFHAGIDQFYAKCAEVGVDSVLIADVPIEHSDDFVLSAKKYHIAPIFICPPNADNTLIAAIAQRGSGYTYFLSRAGVTGAETRAQKPATHLITALAKHNAPPALQGFGISEPSQVKEALEAGAAGAISGSAIVKIIEQNQANQPVLLEKLAEFVSNMKAATR